MLRIREIVFPRESPEIGNSIASSQLKHHIHTNSITKIIIKKPSKKKSLDLIIYSPMMRTSLDMVASVLSQHSLDSFYIFLYLLITKIFKENVY